VYGLASGSGSTTPANLTVTGVPTPGAFGAGATATNLVAADGTKYATWTSTKKNDSGSMTVDGFAPPSAIPVGSILKTATAISSVDLRPNYACASRHG
jgi:hypothetical protein